MPMFSRVLCAASVGVLACFAVVCIAADSKPDPRVEIAAKVGAQPEDLRPSPIPGLYELTRGTDVAYVSMDGKYAIAGDIYDLKTNDNITEARRNGVRKELLARLPESEMMIFGPKTAKYTITVFTDVDCGYCRKMHSEIADYNSLGIRVRYLFYPREGPGSESWKTAEAIWCSPDRKAALTRAKRGEEVKVANCRGNSVARQYELGQKLGIRGTPGIFTSDGGYLPGYLPPQMLLARIQKTGNM